MAYDNEGRTIILVIGQVKGLRELLEASIIRLNGTIKKSQRFCSVSGPPLFTGFLMVDASFSFVSTISYLAMSQVTASADRPAKNSFAVTGPCPAVRPANYDCLKQMQSQNSRGKPLACPSCGSSSWH